MSGVVYDSDGEPAIGASVRVPSTNQAVVTDVDGHFNLSGNFNPSTVIEVSYVGAKTLTVKIGTGSDLRITLVNEENVLNEIVAVGYGTQKRVNLTGSVSTVNVDKSLNGRPITNVASGLQGTVPGLKVTSANGKPGNTASMSIRGVLGSLQGSTSPLILVDNVEVNDISVINPEDIESISVLKDAASASIYGIKGAFGVILITTKQAKAGDKFSISYSNNFSWKSPTVTPELATGSEGATLALLGAQRSKGVSSIINDVGMYWDWNTIDRMKEWERVYGSYNLSPEMVYGRDYEKVNGNLEFYRSWDPYSLMMKSSSFMQTHNIAINGYSGNTSYNVGMGYLGNNGMMRVNNDTQNRYNLTFGTTTQLNNWAQLHTKLMYTRTDTENPYEYNTTYDEFYYLYRWPATYPYGTIDGTPVRNSITERSQANRNKIQNNWMRLNVGTIINLPVRDLSLEADYTYTHVGRYTQTNGGEVSGYDFWSLSDFVYSTWTSASKNISTKSSAFSDYHVFNGLLRYKWGNKTIGDFNAFAGTNIESYNDYGQSGSQLGLVLTDRPEISLATGDMTASSYNNKNTLVGFFGRVNYSWRDRYLLEANVRYDGSSKFPKDKRWGVFPSFSAGWILSNEAFMEDLNPILSFTKLRASWGKIGSQQVSNSMFLGVMSLSESSWIVGENGLYTLSMPTALADGFTWETVTTTDLGFDMRFLNNRLGVSFDWFNRSTNDLINTGASVPYTFGQTAPMTNYGHLTTRGWEISVDYHHHFAFGLDATITANLSDALGHYDNTNPSESRCDYIYDGKTYGEIWGYVTDRLFTADDFLWDDNGNIIGYASGVASQQYLEDQYGNNFHFMPGDVKYKDLNGDGNIDDGKTNGVPTLDNHGDMTVIGNTTPRYQYGIRLDLTYANFDLGVFFQGVGKRDYWGTGQLVIPGWHYGEAYYSHQMDYWTEDNQDAFYPRPWALNYQSANPNFKKQTRYLLNMAYCRWKNLTFGYSLPKNLSRRLSIEKLRIYASFENLLTFDHLNGVPIDPETAVSTGDGGYIGRSYPFSREYSFGIQLSF